MQPGGHHLPHIEALHTKSPGNIFSFLSKNHLIANFQKLSTLSKMVKTVKNCQNYEQYKNVKNWQNWKKIQQNVKTFTQNVNMFPHDSEKCLKGHGSLGSLFICQK